MRSGIIGKCRERRKLRHTQTHQQSRLHRIFLPTGQTKWMVFKIHCIMIRFFFFFIITYARNRSIQTSFNLVYTSIFGPTEYLFKFFLYTNIINLHEINNTYLFICLEHIAFEHVSGTISSYVTEYFHVLRIVRNVKYPKYKTK